MTQRESGQDFDPKHRIIGAVVIVVLAVIFIPLILSERGPPAQRSETESAVAPEPTAEPDKVAVTTLAAPKEAAAKPAAPAPEARKPESPSPAGKPADTKTAAVAPEPKPKATAKPAEGGWVVQVGTFSNTANATRLEQKLRAKGQPLLVEHISLDGAKAVRLRVGPFRDRDAALRVQARISKEVGVKGVVLAYP